MQATTKAAQFFVAPSGKVLVYLSNFPQDGELLYSPDGETFYELSARGFSGSTGMHTLRFSDPHKNEVGSIIRKDDVLYLEGGERYVQ